YLYIGARLANAREQLAAKKIKLNGLARAFVTAGVEAEGANRAREAARLQKELDDARKLAESEKQRAEEQSRSAARLRRSAAYLIGALGVAVLLGIIAGVFGVQSNQNAGAASRNAATAEAASTQSVSEANSRATAEANALIQRDEAQRQQQLSRSRELAAIALNQLSTEPERSILIALEAISVTHTFEAEDALRQALQTSRLRQALRSAANIVDAEFSPDGARVATIDHAGQLAVWDAVTGRRLVEQATTDRAGRRVRFSLDGRWLLTLNEDGRVRLWSTDGFRLKATLQWEEEFDDAWFSADGTRVLTLGSGRARLWRSGDERPITILNDKPVRLTRFSPDGQRIAAATEDRRILVWDAVSGEQLANFPTDGDVTDLRLLPDHQQLILYGFFKDGAVNLQRVDAATGEIKLAYDSDQPGGISWRIDLTQDGQLVAATGGTPVVWDVASGQALAMLRGQTTEVQQVVFSPDGRRLVTAGYDGEVRIWEAKTGRELLVLKGQAGAETRLQFSPDGRHLLTLSGDGAAHLLDVTTAGQLPTQFFAFGGFSWAVLSPDARWLVTAISAPNETATRVWDVATGRAIKTLEAFWSYARFSSDSQWLVGNGDLERDIVRDTATWQSVPLPQRPLSLSPDATLAALGPGLSNRLRIWDVAAKSVVTGLPITPTNPVFSPDNRYLAATATDQVGVWDIASGREVAQLPVRMAASNPMDVVFSPDSAHLLTRDISGTLRLWPLGGGQPIVFVGFAQDATWQAAFAPDGRRLLTFDQTATEAQVWQTVDGKLIARLRGPEGAISSVQFSPDGRTIVAVHNGLTVRLWDAVTGAQQAILRGHAATGVVAQFSPDGQQVVTADPTGTIFRHPVTVEDLAALARTRVTRALSCEERVQYLREETVCPTP
ncbi:partial putative serine/threonine-protein kinase PkwA, partial [Planctomycetaceae bacterium]